MQARSKWLPEMRWLIRQMRPLLPLSLANFICIIVGSTLTLADPLIIKWLIDVAIPRRSLRLVVAAVAADGLTYLASVGMSCLGAVLSSIVGQKLVFRIRLSLLRHVDGSSAAFRNDTQVGETLYRLEQDVNRIAELSSDIFPMGMHMITIGAMAAFTMTFLNWRLTIVVIPLMPLFYFLQRKFAGRLKSAADAAQSQSGKISAFLQEHLAGLLQLQLLNRAGAQRKKFARLSAEGANLQVQQRLAEVWFGASSSALVVLGMSLILGLGGYQVLAGSLTIGGLVAFYAYVVRLFEPVTIAIDLQSRFQRVGASVRRILEIVQSNQPFNSKAPSIVLDRTDSPELAFRSVSFSYRADRPVLHDLTFHVNPGETVAVVGLNGSGKSTLGLLAARIYDPHTGAILVGGCDIREVKRGNLRSTVTLVPQEPILFDDTVRENLLYGNPAATSADLERVSILTEFDRVLRKLPKGFDEPLGPLGARLSGGEKKRLALARTLLQQPRILIVDEVTGALDAPTAAALLRGLESFREDRTLIVISHRPATILWAQRILVVEDGRIAGSGRHSDLMERCQAYRTIWAAQDQTLAVI
jgi:ABC-type multidrug transport system fused ATPase/permease subunit